MSLFRHIKDMNETYIGHMSYAVRLGLALLISGIWFIVHGVLPSIAPPAAFNLDSTYDRVRSVWEYVNRNRSSGSKEKP